MCSAVDDMYNKSVNLSVEFTAAFCRSEDKGQKLREAWDCQQFLRAVEDVEVWIAEMETQLSSEDIGRDLISVNNLLKRHEVRCTCTSPQARIQGVGIGS